MTAAAAALVGALGGCATLGAPELRPFTTDGCSLFPNRAWRGKADWCHCCVAHDLAYWRGGTSAQRLEADVTLKECVLQESNDPALAELMFTGVREGGGPQLATPFRWGYGWSHRRKYEALTADELAHAADMSLHAADETDSVCKVPTGSQ